MLVSFSVENYKSFEKEIKINFEDSHDYKFNNQSIKNGLISKVVIYGPIASGKRNFGFALFDIVGLLTDKNTNPLQNDEFTFLNADSDSKYAIFTYVFRNKKDDITYKYKKKSPKFIAYEELCINGQKIYSYDFENEKHDFLHMDLINAESLNFNISKKI